nr:uncharacterized protein K02A2.6-like [Leptinotarsa decemlineata]
MRTITSRDTEIKLRKTFARFGLPDTVVTDNGPSVVSKEMETFFQRNGIQHLTSPPYNPASNGAAENMVRTFKNKLKTALADPSNEGVQLHILVSRFLINYRNTDHCSTGTSFAQLMFGRPVKKRLSILQKRINRPQEETNVTNGRQEKHIPGRKKLKNFEEGEEVWIKDYKTKSVSKWDDPK